MEISGKKLMAAAGLVAVVMTGCAKAEPQTELDRYLEANVEQSCFVKDYVADKDPNNLSDEQIKELEAKSLEVLQNHGFQVSNFDDAMALSQRLYDQSVNEGTLDDYDAKYLDRLLEEGCITQAEVDQIKAQQANPGQPVVNTPVEGDDVMTDDAGMTPTEEAPAGDDAMTVPVGEGDSVPVEEQPAS